MHRLDVVIASTRPGRKGPAVASWFAGVAERHGGFVVRVVDIVDFDLPVFDEPNHPRLADYVHDHTRRWSASVGSADAFVFVTPEYNFGAPPSLLNAVNYLAAEWACKPAGIVSYGGVSGGLRGAQHLKQVLGALKIVCPPEGVPIPGFSAMIKDGTFHSNELIDTSARVMLDELLFWAGGLRQMRQNRDKAGMRGDGVDA